MDKRKVVTLCGSVKFYDKMQEINEKLALEKIDTYKIRRTRNLGDKR